MKENHESRMLRIEPLENRSLLAGNLFAGDAIALDLFADSAASSGSQQNVEANQTQEVRTIGNDNGPIVQQSDRTNPSNDERGSTPNAQVDFDSQSTVTQSTVTLTPIEDQQSQQSSSAEVANRQTASAVDAAIAAITFSELVTGIVDQVTSPVAEDSLARPLGNSVTGVASNQRQISPLTAGLSAASEEPSNGLIDLSPSNLELSIDDPVDEHHQPWQLDSGVAPHIRLVIEQASNHQAEITDAAIAAWFRGPGGMIAVDQVLLPANAFIAGLDWLDVQLESTVNLHRSLEMIASGTTPPISDVALDAIMASLGEIAGSKVQPINSIYQFEIPRITYPVIAIVTAAAIAARRKHRHPEPLASKVSQHR
ncbi:hypothetical protein FF011L_34730 [Roseimaritima multifibrata]|uniref:Uncharacterized protein n=1 Tax=Roseimaritima multifibrata TaxID=1930274 RepID=A0A517MII0_9BACT|nr:hypothetical protein [Roseimaritima multifibrata]QDS94693.1 hypothetical protein FF011L_34730 [Roseimaritima multifibrata]